MGKKSILLAVTLLNSLIASAQNGDPDSGTEGMGTGWYGNFNAGVGVLSGNSNLSPLGMSYRKNYKSGRIADVQAGYQWNRFWHAGLRFNQLWTSGNYESDTNVSAASFSDNIKVYYIAPQIGLNLYSGGRVDLWLQAGTGYINYRNEFYSFYDNGEKADKLTYTSSSVAVNGDLKLDYRLTKNLYVNATISTLYGGNFKKVKVKNEDNVKETAKPEDFNRIKLWRTDFSLGLTVKF